MSAVTTPVPRPSAYAGRITAVVGLGFIAAYVVALFVLMDRTGYDVWGALLVAPVLIGVTLPMLARQARREADPTLFRVLTLALVVKLGGALARYYVAFTVYGGEADAQAYHVGGTTLAERFRHFDFRVADVAGGGVGTRFVKVLTGALYTVMGPSRLGAFLVFSWLGFLGLYCFYRAFVIAVPHGRARSYAHFLFFLPSLVFWPSSLGKESWMMFTVGVASLGVAKVLNNELVKGLVLTGLGMWGALAVRPHIAGLIGVGLAAAVVTRKMPAGMRELAPLVKTVMIAVVCVVALVLVKRTAVYLENSGVDTSHGVATAATALQARTAQGGSEFTPVSVADSPLNLPAAAITVLFRPLITEAHNAQSLAQAMEGGILLLIVLVRSRWLVAALRAARTTPYLVFAMAYTALFIVGFSTLSNFGILARERVQLYPLFLIVLCIPPPDWAPYSLHGMRRPAEETSG